MNKNSRKLQNELNELRILNQNIEKKLNDKENQIQEFAPKLSGNLEQINKMENEWKKKMQQKEKVRRKNLILGKKKFFRRSKITRKFLKIKKLRQKLKMLVKKNNIF